MSEFQHDTGTQWREDVTRRELDGEERVPFLPLACMVAIAPAVEPEDPAYVFIEWGPGRVERATPGSAVWRAVLEHYLDTDHSSEPHDDILRLSVAHSLVRFPSLDAWFRWRDLERRAGGQEDDVADEPPAKLGWARLLWPW